MAVNVDKLKKRILAEKARLEHDQARLINHSGDSMTDDVGDIADFDTNHPGDYGTETFERGKDDALNQNLDVLLAQIESALAKIENGTYGVCDRCGNQIAQSRLEALPYATLCIECQARVESQ